jgi:hypothetical protein
MRKREILMTDHREQSIRERAYQIWVEEGRPEGRHDRHWRQAEAELLSGTAAPLQPELTDGGEGNAPEETLVAGGLNPDDVTR